jgi:hypothetical protein
VKDDSTGNDFAHEETRDGDDTQGSYHVLLPDRRLQKVTYYVSGDSGFVAKVEYEGEAQYPAHNSASAEHHHRQAATSSASEEHIAAPGHGHDSNSEEHVAHRHAKYVQNAIAPVAYHAAPKYNSAPKSGEQKYSWQY